MLYSFVISPKDSDAGYKMIVKVQNRPWIVGCNKKKLY